METPVTLEGIRSGSLLTLSRGEIFSPQRISESGVNLVGKEFLIRSWDVHSERLLECSNCHFSVNNPIFRKEPEVTQPKGLKFDSRRMPLGAYLQRPNHNFAGQSDWTGQTKPIEALGCESCHDPEPTHEWLPYAKRHTDALTCEVCHSPMLYSVAVESVDWTNLNDQGEPAVTWRGCEAGCETAATDLVRGIEPAILARQDADGRTRLAPYNLVTSWYWVGGAEKEPVRLDLVMDASESGSAEDVATRLEALGVEEPRIKGEIKPYPIHHGVAEGRWATRDCQSCHGQDSRLARSVVLAKSAPGGVVPTLAPESAGMLAGLAELDDEGRVVYTPRTASVGLYVLGHDSLRWANLLGVLGILATLLGVAIHGGLRWWAARSRPPGDHGAGPSVYMYTTYERVWHWVQALAIMLLLFTGIEVHVTSLGLMDFALAVRVHNVLGFLVVANAVFAAFYHIASGEIRQYLPRPQGFFGQAIAQGQFYLLGIFRGDQHPVEKNPQRKLNPLQQVTYLGILNVLLPLQIITGILIWGVQQWPAVDGTLGGLTLLAPLHAFGAWMFAAFLIMHIYLTTTGPTPVANIRAMVVGWEALETAEESPETS
jgi:thiosulfate reductase cytochrome b subunit